MTMRKMLFILGMAILLNQNVLADTSKDGTKVTFTIINDSDFPAQFIGTDQGYYDDPINTHLNGRDDIFNFYPLVLAKGKAGVLTVNLPSYLSEHCFPTGCAYANKDGATMMMRYGMLGSGKYGESLDHCWCAIYFLFEDKDPGNPDGTGRGRIDHVESVDMNCEKIDSHTFRITNKDMSPSIK